MSRGLGDVYKRQLYHIAQTPQALRGVVNLFSNAYDNEDYSYEGLVAMAKYMDMEV